MTTKIVAARIAVTAGCHLCIAAGTRLHPLRRIEAGARCTWFVAEALARQPCASSGSRAR